MKQIIITTGDADGIGQEVCLKALESVLPKNDIRFLIFSPQENRWPKKIGAFRTKILQSIENIQYETLNKNEITVCRLNKTPHFLVKMAAERALKFKEQGVALINAPMSKNRRGEGHTEILKRVSGQSNVTMGFLGSKFNICLATTHIAVDEVYTSLNKEKIKDVWAATEKLHQISKNNSGEIRVLGLNPHCGENGAISKQDRNIVKSLPIRIMEVPDAAFTHYKRGDTFLAWYHDQGLIPFKMVHGFENGIQVTLGLPFIRTSVDHGTAKDIFGKDIADGRSMKLALKEGIRLVKTYNNTLY